MSFSHILDISLSKKMTGTNISSILAHLLLNKMKKEKEKEQPYSLVYLIESMHFLSIRKPFHILKGKHNWVKHYLIYSIESMHFLSIRKPLPYSKGKTQLSKAFLNLFNWIYAFLEYKETLSIFRKEKHNWVSIP